MRNPYFHEIHCESSFLVIVIFIIIKATLWTTDFSSIFECVCVSVCLSVYLLPYFQIFDMMECVYHELIHDLSKHI